MHLLVAMHADTRLANNDAPQSRQNPTGAFVTDAATNAALHLSRFGSQIVPALATSALRWPWKPTLD